jgi:hypothetical protein
MFFIPLFCQHFKIVDGNLFILHVLAVCRSHEKIVDCTNILPQWYNLHIECHETGISFLELGIIH